MSAENIRIPVEIHNPLTTQKAVVNSIIQTSLGRSPVVSVSGGNS